MKYINSIWLDNGVAWCNKQRSSWYFDGVVLCIPEIVRKLKPNLPLLEAIMIGDEEQSLNCSKKLAWEKINSLKFHPRKRIGTFFCRKHFTGITHVISPH